MQYLETKTFLIGVSQGAFFQTETCFSFVLFYYHYGSFPFQICEQLSQHLHQTLPQLFPSPKSIPTDLLKTLHQLVIGLTQRQYTLHTSAAQAYATYLTVAGQRATPDIARTEEPITKLDTTTGRPLFPFCYVTILVMIILSPTYILSFFSDSLFSYTKTAGPTLVPQSGSQKSDCGILDARRTSLTSTRSQQFNLRAGTWIAASSWHAWSRCYFGWTGHLGSLFTSGTCAAKFARSNHTYLLSCATYTPDSYRSRVGIDSSSLALFILALRRASGLPLSCGCHGLH